MSTPAIPAGYRRLSVGEKRPKGYKFYQQEARRFRRGLPDSVGFEIGPFANEFFGPYIAPVIPRKGGKKGKKL